MTEVIVNGIQVDPSAYPSPEAAAAHELLRQRALQLGLLSEDMDESGIAQALEQLLEREVTAAEASEAECRRYYEAHPEEFTSGELAFARHILYQVTPGVSVPALRANAELTLAGLMRDPERFESVAREYSNCPSASQGGNLGQLLRGETVPEFEQALFNGAYLGIYPQLVKTRFGFHILAVDRREPGRLVPFEAVRTQIASRLAERGQRSVLARYVSRLAGTAQIEGADLGTMPAV